jgi:hypothetical protein
LAFGEQVERFNSSLSSEQGEAIMKFACIFFLLDLHDALQEHITCV